MITKLSNYNNYFLRAKGVDCVYIEKTQGSTIDNVSIQKKHTIT